MSRSQELAYILRSEINLIPSTNSFNNVSHKMPFLGLRVKNLHETSSVYSSALRKF